MVIDDTRLDIETKEINYEVSILKGKSLELKFNVGGNVAEGYRFAGVQSSANTVLVAGDPAVLDGLKTIEIPSSVLDISAATADKSIVIDVADFLPENVHADGNTQVSVTLKVEAIGKKNISITLSDITLTGTNSLYSYALLPSTITVGVSGLERGLAKLGKSDLNASIDLSNFTLGEHNVDIKFTLPSGYSVDSHTPCKIVVSKASEESSSSSASVSSEESSSAEATIPSSTQEKESSKENTKNSTKENMRESTKSTIKESNKSSTEEGGTE